MNVVGVKKSPAQVGSATLVGDGDVVAGVVEGSVEPLGDHDFCAPLQLPPVCETHCDDRRGGLLRRW